MIVAVVVLGGFISLTNKLESTLLICLITMNRERLCDGETLLYKWFTFTFMTLKNILERRENSIDVENFCYRHDQIIILSI